MVLARCYVVLSERSTRQNPGCDEAFEHDGRHRQPHRGLIAAEGEPNRLLMLSAIGFETLSSGLGSGAFSVLLARYPGDQGNQYFASTRAVFDDLSEEQLAGEQGRCAEAVDQDWSGDDW